MTHFGFRLYEVTLRRGTKQAKIPFQLAGVTPESPRHFREILVELLDDLQGKRLVGQPKVQSAEGAGVELTDDAPVAKDLIGETAFRIEAFREKEGLIVGVVRRGRYGTFDKAMGDDAAADVGLTGLAVSTWYRFVVNLPEEGTVGVVAIEEVDRAAPIDLLLKWLGQHSRTLAEKQPALGTGQPAAPWWRLIGRQVTDPDNLERLLKQGQFGAVTLVKKGFGAGRGQKDRAYTVTAPGVRQSKLDDLRKVVLGWRPDEGSDAPPTTDAQGAQQLAALISPDLQGISFDDGQIAVPGSGARPLKPTRLAELFTYDQNPPDRRSAAVPFYRAVRGNVARLDALHPADEAGLDWPDDVDLDFPEVSG